MSVNGRWSNARRRPRSALEQAVEGPANSPRDISLIWSSRISSLPGRPATAGPKLLPTWKKKRLSTIAVSAPRVMPELKMISPSGRHGAWRRRARAVT